MRLSSLSVGGLALVAILGVASANPGILDLFSSEAKYGPSYHHHGHGHGHGPPSVKTVYVVKPPHGPPPPYSHGPPKTVVKYVSKPPYSPFSSGWGSSSSSSSSAPYKKGSKSKKPMMVVEEEEVVEMMGSPGPRPMMKHRGIMQPPPEMSHEKPRSSKGKKTTGGAGPAIYMMGAPGHEGGDEGNESEFGVSAKDLGSRPESFMGFSEGKPGKGKPLRGKSKPPSYSSESEWGPAKTVTYVTTSSSGGWGPSPGWGWNPPPSYGWGGWGSDDDEWPSLGGGGDGWSSDGDEGWSQGPPPPGPEGGKPTGEEGPMDEEETPDPVAPEPEDPVHETGVTEEGEDRRPPMIDIRQRPKSMPASVTQVSSVVRRPGVSAETEVRQLAREKEAGSSGSGYSSSQTSSTQNETPKQVYGVPVPSISSGIISSANSGELRFGGQTVSGEDGYLDDELLKTVQQIIEKYDKN